MVKKIKEDTDQVAENQAPVQEETKNNIFKKEGELVCDIYETQAEFVVMSAIAGVVIKDLDISIEKDMMVIKGDRKSPHLVDDKKYLFQECYWGPFSKKVILPDNIDAESAQAEMDKGILTIKFPKIEKNSKDKLNIKSA